MIICDNDAALLGADFRKVLDDNEIALNTNVPGDHHAMGIIDRFALRIKLTFGKTFKRNGDKHIWLPYLQSTIKKYNDKSHSSLGGISPNEAGQDQHFEKVLKINQMKQTYNKTVSTLQVGDTVRKLEKSEKLHKSTEPIWSDDTYKVVKVKGKTITLDDEARHKRANLLKVSE